MKKRKQKRPLVQLVLPNRPAVPSSGQSEVARIRAHIVAEQESARRALYSTAYGTAQHKFISRRMERMGMLQEELTQLVGEEQAMQITVQAMGANHLSRRSDRKAGQQPAAAEQ